MYAGDSFWTLNGAGQAGLALLSVLLALVMLRLALLGQGPVWRRVARALLLWWLFLWLSPQVYYAFYWSVIPDLPVQLVVGRPPGPAELGKLLAFLDTSIADHCRGALGWGMVLVAVLGTRVRRREH